MVYLDHLYRDITTRFEINNYPFVSFLSGGKRVFTLVYQKNNEDLHNRIAGTCDGLRLYQPDDTLTVVRVRSTTSLNSGLGHPYSMGDQFRKYGVELRMPRGRPGGAGGVGWLIALGAGAVLVNASLYNGAPTTFFFRRNYLI